MKAYKGAPLLQTNLHLQGIQTSPAPKGMLFTRASEKVKGTTEAIQQSNQAEFSQWNSFIATIRHGIEKLFTSMKND